MALWIIGMNQPTAEELAILPSLVRSLQRDSQEAELPTGSPEYRMTEYVPSYLH